ncbi:hypothetical protein [Kitasatospora sp. NPDC058046]|uniref:hypothetical protein n=1 Tax=Kitasatospora sp. NPDC058046 TaxID=3346312 RepID=UPI0036DEAEF9
MTAPLATSRYTLRVPLTEGYALFNTSTGSVMKFDGPQAEEATALLSGNRRLVAPGSALEETARSMLPPQARDTQDIVGGFPHPKTSVCGALAEGSAVVGADGLEYRCGLQVGEQHRAVGRLRALPTAALPLTVRASAARVSPGRLGVRTVIRSVAPHIAVAGRAGNRVVRRRRGVCGGAAGPCGSSRGPDP